jgi:hypothetical protein
MFPTDTRTPADFPMPELDCPTWCERDHYADWYQHVAVGLDTRRIPDGKGGFLPDHRCPIEQWCSMDYFSSLHVRSLASMDLGGTESADVDIQRSEGERDNETTLYIDAQGVMNTAQARMFAAELLNAADALDGITR